MANVQELIDKRLTLWEQAKTFLDEHTDKNGIMPAEDAATYERMISHLEALDKNIKRFENQERMGAELSAPTTKPILNYPQKAGTKVGRASNEYKQAALTALRTNFKTVSNYLQEGADEQGGFLVPEEWSTRLIDVLDEENVMRGLGTKITTSGIHKINVTASKPGALWVAEGGQLTFGDATFGQKTLDAHKLHVGVKITNELLYDNAFDLETYIIEQFGKAIANVEEDAFINGTGTGQPTGVLTTLAANSDTTITTTGASISADDILNLIYGLKRPYRKNAVFLINDNTLAIIRKLKDANQAYMWQPSLQAGEPDTLLGYKVYSSPYFPTMAAGKIALAFGDFSYYNIGDRGTRSFKELRELFAGNDMTGFLMIERVDGVLMLDEAVRALKMKGGS